MDTTEYKLLKLDYTDDEKRRINDFNQQHLNMARELLKYNRDKLLNDKEYADLDIIDRNKEISSSHQFKDFF